MSETSPKSQISGAIVLLDGDHSGRDEMNLAGNPFALLQAASKNSQTFIRREWERRLGNGKLVTATWHVNGHATLGLPGPNEELLYLVLLQITREQKEREGGEWPQTVYFSRHDVLTRLRWHDGPREYKNLKDAFARLQAVSIQAEWSFYDLRTGAPAPFVAFNLVDSVIFTEEKRNRRQHDLPLSFFKWSDEVFASLKAGFVRSLALDFALTLESPTALRLFRLLELMRHKTKPPLSQVSLETFDLRDRLGMTAYAFPSKVREKIAPAVIELQNRGYLEKMEVEKSKAAEKCVFTFARVAGHFSSPSPVASTTPAISTPPASPSSSEGAKKPFKTSSSTCAPEKKEADAPETSGVNTSKRTTKTASGKSTAGHKSQVTKTQTAKAQPVLGTREVIVLGFEIWQGLSEPQREALRATARQGVERDFWDRLEAPESPISERLFRLVWEEYGSKKPEA